MVMAPLSSLPEPRFRAVMERELRDLSASLERHFSYEEEGEYPASGGTPETVDGLLTQHKDILARIDRLVTNVPSRPLDKLAGDVTELLDTIEQHENIEAKLFER